MPVTSLFARGLVALLLAGGLSVAEAPAPASATSTRLCLGYAGCARAGYSNAGYQQKSGTMWWRMYSGHNCTNYVAYRMVKSGLSNSRPWSGSGNATNWGVARSDITDQTPKVGAVAWWRAYARPAGSAGHVAYVEKVISSTEIIVSQDSWGGDFSWARITRAGGSWPSGFVHFNDIALRNTAKPVITGTAKVGSVLTSSTGTWSKAGASYTYQWRADGTDIAGATGRTYTLGTAQQGKKISVLVHAAKAGYPTAHAYAAQTAAVLPGVLSSLSRPVVTGTPRVDAPLTVSSGTWSPSPTSMTYQWSVAGSPVAGATHASFTPTAALAGKVLKVKVTATRTGFQPVATTLTLPKVATGTFTPARPASLGGEPRPGATLMLDLGTVSPTPAGTTLRWLRDGVAIRGADQPTYVTTAADLGARLSAQVTRTRAGYAPLVSTTEASHRIRSVPTVRVTARPGGGLARVWVTVLAQGTSPVTGVVRVAWRGKVTRDLTLSRGTTSTTLTGIPAGARHLHVHYLGSRTVTSHLERRVVDVR